MKLRVITNEKDLFSLAAKSVANQLSLAIKKKDFATIALAGGRSAATLCLHLVKQKNVNWNKVHIFMIDERLVPITDVESNFKIINDMLIKPLNQNKQSKQNILRSNVHPFVYDETEDDGGASRYESELVSVGGSFDVIFVSAGEDGHIAGLYPHHSLLKNKSDLFATFHDSPKPPAHRMTALSANFFDATFSLLLIVGDSKREALTKLQNKKITINDCPAKLVTKSKSHLILTNLKKEKNTKSKNRNAKRKAIKKRK